METEEEVIVNLFDEGEDKLIEPTPKTVVEDETPSFEMPEKFAGKSVEEVAEAYKNLESEYGRKSNEVGELRQLTDEILRQQVSHSNSADENINESVEDFDFYDDPSAAVEKALANNPRLQKIEEQMFKEAHKNSHSELIALHSDADEVVASEGFNEWIKGSSGRLKMLQDAHNNHDVALAGDILDMYKATSESVNADAIMERDEQASEQLRNASVERGRPSANTKPVYRRSELIKLKTQDPRRYEKMSKEIIEAYADGRVK